MKGRHYWFSSAWIVLLTLMVSCGMEVFIYLYPVIYRDFDPTSDPTYNYFSFRTSDERNMDEAGDFFKGFEIYYRLYNNSTVAASDRSAINTKNTDTPTQAYTYLINTKRYVRLLCDSRGNTVPLLPAASSNRKISVRLVPYVDQVPSIVISDLYDQPMEQFGTPRRSVVETFTSQASLFEFDEIGEGDLDVYWSSTWDDVNDKKWYMQAYVMAYGYDSSYKPLYSELFYLGMITISER